MYVSCHLFIAGYHKCIPWKISSKMTLPLNALSDLPG